MYRKAILLCILVLILVMVPSVAYGEITQSNIQSPMPSIVSKVRQVTATVSVSHRTIPLNQSLIGFDGPGPSQAETSIKALQPRYIRTDVSFQATYNGKPVYNCTTGSWNPVLLDKSVAGIRAEGASPELIVDYTPSCLATALPGQTVPSQDIQYLPPDVGRDQALWSALVEKMAYHEIVDEGVRVFEVWNEPDWAFWQGGLAGYLTLYRVTSLALEAAAEQAHVKIEVGGPALANVKGTMDTSWLDPFLHMVAVDHLPLNFLSWHLYASDPDSGPNPIISHGLCMILQPNPSTNPCYYNPDLYTGLYEKEAQQARAALAPYPMLHPKLWIDEWNINGGYDRRVNTSYGAAFVLSVLQAANSAGINRMCYYNVWNSGHNRFDDTGVLNPSLTPKPDYHSFYFWHELTGPSLKVTTTPSQDPQGHSGGTGVIATVPRSGMIRIAAYDFKPYDPSGNYGMSLPTHSGVLLDIKLAGLPNGFYPQVAFSTAARGPVLLGESAAGDHHPASIRLLLPDDGVAMLAVSKGKAPSSFDTLSVVIISIIIALILLVAVAIFILIVRRRLHVRPVE